MQNFSTKELFDLFGSTCVVDGLPISKSEDLENLLKTRTFVMFDFLIEKYSFVFMIGNQKEREREYMFICANNSSLTYCIPPKYIEQYIKHYGSIIPDENNKKFGEVLDILLLKNPNFVFHLDIFI